MRDLITGGDRISASAVWKKPTRTGADKSKSGEGGAQTLKREIRRKHGGCLHEFPILAEIVGRGSECTLTELIARRNGNPQWL